jgi:hypothetical protein
MKRYTIKEMENMSGLGFAASVLRGELSVRTNYYTPVAQKLGEAISELELTSKARLFYRDLKEMFCAWETARARNPMLRPLIGYIVFKNNSMETPVASLAARTYRVSSDVFGSYANIPRSEIRGMQCATEQWVDLKPLMIEEDGGEHGWRVDYCLLAGREN